MGSAARSALAELVATFGLVVATVGSTVVAGPSGAGLVGVALASGFALAALVSVTAPVSGGHANPAVTIATWVLGRTSGARAILYVSAQLVGAVLAAALVRLAFPGPSWRAAALGAPLLAPRMGGGRAVLLEATLTFLLTFAYLGSVGDDRTPSPTSGIPAGLALALGILVGGPLTGASLNPARAFGPELVGGVWANWWVYWAGPIAGGALAAAVHWLLFLRPGEPSFP
ncbi:MAG TPA: aquaporin [Actinomycetota bacterium]|nr:aquaporin [Actinomycetota bacterium]